MDDPDHPRLNVLIAAVLFSTAAPVTKFVDFGPLSVTFFRSLAGIVALVLLTFNMPRRELLKFTIYDFLGGMAYAATSLCFFSAMSLTTAANAIILFQTTPVFLIPLGFLFLGEKAGGRDILSIILMLGGIVLCFREGMDIGGQWGDLLALGGAVSFGLMSIIMKKNPGRGSTRLLIVGNLLIILITLPFQNFDNISLRDAGLSSALGIFHMAIPLLLIARGLRVLPALEVSIIKNLETVLSPLWVAFLVSEIPGFYSILGFIAVMAAILVGADVKPGRLIRRRD